MEPGVQKKTLITEDEFDRRVGLLLGSIVGDWMFVAKHWPDDGFAGAKTAPSVPNLLKPSATRPSRSHSEEKVSVGSDMKVPDIEQPPQPAKPWCKGAKNEKFSPFAHQLLAVTASIAEKGGEYDSDDHLEALDRLFGYGGEYSGPVDRLVKETLNNIVLAENRAASSAQAVALPKGSTDDDRRLLQKVVNKHWQEAATGSLVAFRGALLGHLPESFMDAAFQCAEIAKQAFARSHGSKHRGPGALSVVPAIVAMYAGDKNLLDLVEQAVRVTCNHEEAITVAKTVAVMMECAVKGQTASEAVKTALDLVQSPEFAADEKYHAMVQKALSIGMTHIDDEVLPVDGARECGRGSRLDQLLSSSVALMIRRDDGSYVVAQRDNFAVSDHAVERNLIVGPIMGAVAGAQRIPLHWIVQVPNIQHVVETIKDCVTARFMIGSQP